MLVLGLDTATPAVTVAVADGGSVLAESAAVDARRHGELLAPAIASALAGAGVAAADLDAVAVGVGPGPFTGLRVGLVTARTMAATLGLPVHGVCTLDLLAAEVAGSGRAGGERPDRLLVATDARRREVYWAAYDLTAYDDASTGRPFRLDGPHVSRPSDVGWAGPVVGEGPRLYPEAFPDGRAPLHPSAAVLCRWVAEGRPTGPPEPLYLRRPDATEPAGARKTVL